MTVHKDVEALEQVFDGLSYYSCKTFTVEDL